MAARPTGTVTFLFTDIEGSSRLWKEEPAAMSEALARHDTVVRGAIEGHDGYIFATGGDGFAAAFGRSRDAARAAAAAQAELEAQAWPPEARIRVRMAIHTGEAEERHGDYFGSAVNETARLTDLGRGGHVLVSDVTARLLGDRLSLVDFGDHQLRDVDGPVRVHALDSPGTLVEPLETTDGPARPADPAESRVRFGNVVVDLARMEVHRDGAEVRVEPQVFEVLRHLIANRDRVVSKEDLMDSVWGDRFVSESALTSRIKSARRAIGDDGQRQEAIRTIHGRGYRFVAPLDRAAAETATASAGAAELTPADRPTPQRPLVGRTVELATLEELLGRTRLVTLTGPGGVGKTRLATELAARWERDRDVEVFFVPLSPVDDPGQVPASIAKALGLRASGGGDALAAVVEALRHRPSLIVLDNFEQVTDAAPTVAALLTAANDTSVVVTSRERLHLVDEQTFELLPLPTHVGPAIEPTADQLSPAVRLFEQSVQAADPAFRVTGANIEDVGAVCARLDGLPLAIELAAAQLRYLPLGYLRTHIESNVVAIGDDALDRPGRHHSLGDAVAWSHALLTPEAQRLFMMTSVFAGSWSLEDAAALHGDADPTTLLRQLAVLVDKSLIRRVDHDGDHPRFSMLHIIREFASERLAESDLWEPTHVANATRLAAHIDRVIDWNGPIHRWVDDINEEWDNIRAALDWTFRNGRHDLGCRIVAGLNFWWFRAGYHREGRHWVGLALNHVHDQPPLTAARLHAAAGRLAFAACDQASAEEHLEEALRIAEQVDDPRFRALAAVNLTLPAIGRPDRFTEAHDRIRDAIATVRVNETRSLLAHSLNILGELLRVEGHLDEAEEAYLEAFEINRSLGDRHYEAINLANLSHVAEARSDFRQALDLSRAGLELSWRVRSRVMTAWSVSETGGLLAQVGRPETAARLIGGADAAMELIGAHVTPGDQPAHERAVGALTGALGHVRYDELVAEGRALTLEQCVELALEHLPSE